MAELFSFKRKIDLEGYTLIIPSVSVGNVPQLTVDLLIASLNFEKVATIWHKAIVPSVGSDPYVADGPEICTACELYASEDLKIAVIQLRSTLKSEIATKFFSDFKESISKFEIKNIIILASSFDHELHVVSSDKFYYITNYELDSVMKRLNVKPKEVEPSGRYLVHGSGFAMKLFESLKIDFACTVLIKYVSEGDNRPDAIATLDILSKYVNTLSDLNVKNLKSPISWNSLFGGPPPVGIY